MPLPPSLPPHLRAGPFTVAGGRAAGLSVTRMERRDLDAPRWGVRTPRRARPATLADRCREVLCALPDGTFLTHRTAAELWGLPLPSSRDVRIHVAVRPPRRASRRTDTIAHTLADDAVRVVRRQGLPVADFDSVFLQLAQELTLPDLVAVGDAAILGPVHPRWGDPRPWTSIEALAERVDGYRGRGTRRARHALTLLVPGAESRPESILRVHLVTAGLPVPEVNPVLRRDAGQFIARVDLLFRRWRVVVEYDGDQHRTSRAQFVRDVERLDALAAAGWRVVRVLGEELFSRPDDVVARVARVLRAAGWDGVAA